MCDTRRPEVVGLDMDLHGVVAREQIRDSDRPLRLRRRPRALRRVADALPRWVRRLKTEGAALVTCAWRGLAMGILLSMTLACGEQEHRATPRAEPSAPGEATGEAPAAPEAPVVTTPDLPPVPAEPPAPDAPPDEAVGVPAPETPAPSEPTPDVPDTMDPGEGEREGEGEGEGEGDEGSAPEAPALSLEELEHELRKTRALGFLTRLALKNDIDDLLDAMRAFHEKGNGELPDLRERFDLLVMKVMSLLQDDDPELAHRIADARDALWKLLEDPREFAKLST
jgi:type IV secretory pathway VirB10-like protein